MTGAQIDQMIQDHLEHLKEAADLHAEQQGVRITSIGFPYPNFWETEESAQSRLHRILTELLEDKIRSVFGDVKSTPINERQTIAYLICERFWDPVTMKHRQYLPQLFPGLADEKELALVICDTGSGSMVSTPRLWTCACGAGKGDREEHHSPINVPR